MWFVYHVMPALLAAASGICLYVSLRHMPCDTAAGRKVKLAATLLAVAGMLDFCSVWTLFMMHLCVFLLLWLLLRKLAHRRMIWGFPLSWSVGAGADHRRHGAMRASSTGPIMSW